jgi:hypothetical protein
MVEIRERLPLHSEARQKHASDEARTQQLDSDLFAEGVIDPLTEIDRPHAACSEKRFETISAERSAEVRVREAVALARSRDCLEVMAIERFLRVRKRREERVDFRTQIRSPGADRIQKRSALRSFALERVGEDAEHG